MRERAISCVSVMDGTTLLGILTARYHVEAAGDGVRPSMVRVEDYMNSDPASTTLDEMLAIGCRHLPVNDRGNLVGTIPTRDVYRASVQSGSEGMLVS